MEPYWFSATRALTECGNRSYHRYAHYGGDSELLCQSYGLGQPTTDADSQSQHCGLCATHHHYEFPAQWDYRRGVFHATAEYGRQWKRHMELAGWKFAARWIDSEQLRSDHRYAFGWWNHRLLCSGCRLGYHGCCASGYSDQCIYADSPDGIVAQRYAEQLVPGSHPGERR